MPGVYPNPPSVTVIALIVPPAPTTAFATAANLGASPTPGVLDKYELGGCFIANISYGDMAFACYTAHNKFNYMGKANDDIAVFTSVLQRGGGDWVVVHGQRSSGRSPTDEPPKF